MTLAATSRHKYDTRRLNYIVVRLNTFTLFAERIIYTTKISHTHTYTLCVWFDRRRPLTLTHRSVHPSENKK